MTSSTVQVSYGPFSNSSVNSLTNSNLGTQQSINLAVTSAITAAGNANGASLASVYNATVNTVNAQAGTNNSAV
jgi:hypothetical protein